MEICRRVGLIQRFFKKCISCSSRRCNKKWNRDKSIKNWENNSCKNWRKKPIFSLKNLWKKPNRMLQFWNTKSRLKGDKSYILRLKRQCIKEYSSNILKISLRLIPMLSLADSAQPMSTNSHWATIADR